MKLLLSSALLLMLISGCAVSHSQSLSFKWPLKVDNLVPADSIAITCDSREGARYMARTGFYYPGCQRVKTSPGTKVLSREYENVGEGGMWLLRIRSASGNMTWLVLPWHDWA